MKRQCECMDAGCPIHKASPRCLNTGMERLYRIDCVDENGTLFCIDCSDDAFDSGLYSTEESRDE